MREFLVDCFLKVSSGGKICLVHSKMNQPSRNALQYFIAPPPIILKVVIVFSRKENQAYVGW